MRKKSGFSFLFGVQTLIGKYSKKVIDVVVKSTGTQNNFNTMEVSTYLAICIFNEGYKPLLNIYNQDRRDGELIDELGAASVCCA